MNNGFHTSVTCCLEHFNMLAHMLVEILMLLLQILLRYSLCIYIFMIVAIKVEVIYCCILENRETSDHPKPFEYKEFLFTGKETQKCNASHQSYTTNLPQSQQHRSKLLSFSFTKLSCSSSAPASFSKLTGLDRELDYLLVDLMKVVLTDAIAKSNYKVKFQRLRMGFRLK